MKNNSFYVNVNKINIAHRFVLNKNNKCAYPNGRKYCGLIYIIDGEAEFVFISKKRETVKKGDIMLLSPEAAYSINTKKRLRALYRQF